MPVREAFKLGRILVVPSRAESLPYVVLEAAGARVPLISTDVGGIPEIFGPYRDRLGPCDDPRRSLRAHARDAAPVRKPSANAQAAELAAYVATHFSIARHGRFRDGRLSRGDGAARARSQPRQTFRHAVERLRRTMAAFSARDMQRVEAHAPAPAPIAAARPVQRRRCCRDWRPSRSSRPIRRSSWPDWCAPSSSS